MNHVKMTSCCLQGLSSFLLSNSSTTCNLEMELVPKKQVKSHGRLPWITTQIKEMMQKRERLFRLARSSKRALHWQSYKKYHNFVQRQIHLAQSNYLNEGIGGSLEVADAKAFWNYIKLQPTESIRIPPLQVRVNVFDSNERKADILNKHFQSAFTLEDTSSLPQLPPSPYPQTDQVITNTPGLEKQLQKLKPNKAAGPDQISPWVLKTFAPQCAQILQVIFTQSYESGILHEEWKKALVSPVYKKDDE